MSLNRSARIKGAIVGGLLGGAFGMLVLSLGTDPHCPECEGPAVPPAPPVVAPIAPPVPPSLETGPEYPGDVTPPRLPYRHVGGPWDTPRAPK